VRCVAHGRPWSVSIASQLDLIFDRKSN
jgi:hypothetical protein